MVVHDLDIVRVPAFPTEANTPLIVDPNRMLPGAIPFQGLKSKAGAGQICERPNPVEQGNAPLGGPLERLEPRDSLAPK